MLISAVTGNMPFGRTLTKHEENELKKLETQAKEQLGTEITTATIFDFSLPKEKHDTGIGTSFSEDAQQMAAFLKTLCGINSIQLQPQGQISNFIRSPYSGTSFALGMHIIDLNKLTGKKYGCILKEEDLNKPYMNKKVNKDNVDYDNVFAEDGQKAMLKTAYDNFKKLRSNSNMKKDFEAFKHSNDYWLEKDALYEACAIANGTDNSFKWSERDQNIFASKEGDKERIEELKKITDEDGRNIVDFEEFVQFIADKEQQESKEKFNKKGIEIYGDCQIGFSQKDVWAHKSAFSDNLEFGCDIGYGKHSCWSPAIDFNKLDGDAGELLYNKFDLFFKRYDGVRIDAAWQLVKPLLVEPIKNENGEDVFDENGNKLGIPINNQPWAGGKIIGDIAVKAAENNGVEPKKIFLEMLGGNSYEALHAVKGLGTTLIHITKYANDYWGRVKFYESHGGSNYQNMNPGDYIIGPGTHDDESLLSQYENYGNARAYLLAGDLGLNPEELRSSRSKWAEASFAELFTTKNQFATLPDILGSSRRINEPDIQNGNWKYRAKKNYKQMYYENLSNGLGLNLPDALSKALKAKGMNSQLTDKLDYYADILREPEENTSKLCTTI